MKKKILILSGIIATFMLVGWGNKDWFDFTYTYDRAIISLPDGTVIDGKVQSWTDYEDGDQLQIKIDENIYLVHSMNVALIREEE